MSYGFPAYHSEVYSAGTGKYTDLRAAVKATLAAVSWSTKEETGAHILAATRMGLRSWGERVLIDFLPDNSIRVTSKCVFPLQVVDWGKNKANVARFIAEIGKHV